MAKCDACGSTIIFGGVQEGNYLFCNGNCLEKGNLLMLADQIPGDILEEHLHAVFHGKCPRCEGEGPVDIHTSYFVWSALLLTSWKNTPNICCKSCGVKDQAFSAIGSLFAGWWGFPWGLIMTPVQIARNLAGIFHGRDPSLPSEELRRQVKLLLAERVIMESQKGNPGESQVPGDL